MKIEIDGNSYEDAYNQALRFLGPRFLSRQELQKKLAHKGYNQEPIEKVLQKLEELDYINDERLAKQVWRLFSEERKYGWSYIQQKMWQRGLRIPTEIERVEYDEEEIARELWEHKFSYLIEDAGQITDKDIRKVANFFKNRGFSMGVIQSVVSLSRKSN